MLAETVPGRVLRMNSVLYCIAVGVFLENPVYIYWVDYFGVGRQNGIGLR